jgi:formylglycine-generating enzyme required for sulfatase activity
MPKEPSWGWRGNTPIVSASWHDALNYCEWLSEMLDQKISLPTETQWEYAARGGTRSKGYKYAGGNSMETSGWFNNNNGYKTHRVATKTANELGLYDMNGNLWEWCLDWYKKDYYENSPNKNPENTARGKGKKVLRGGRWKSFTSLCRIAERYFIMPENKHANFGFRVVSFYTQE